MATRTKNQDHRRGWAGDQSVLFYRFATLVMREAIRLLGSKVHAYGVGHVPANRGAFLIVNHTSFLDPIVVTVALNGVVVRGPGKKYLFNNRLFALVLRKLGIFPLQREHLDAAAVRTMIATYRADMVVELYPEGGRSASGELGPFDRDFTRLVLRLRAPLIPAGIAGARDLLPYDSIIPRPGHPVVVVFGREFDLSAYYGPKPTAEVVEEATAILEQQVGAMVAEARARLAEITETDG